MSTVTSGRFLIGVGVGLGLAFVVIPWARGVMAARKSGG